MESINHSTLNKETYWTQFAKDFESKNNYVVGTGDMAVMLRKTSYLNDLNHVLELGCGNGTYSKVLARKAAFLTATDLSDPMVVISKERLKDLSHVKVEQADCSHLQYSNESFDSVFMANLLHVIDEPNKAISESYRVLKKGGRVIALDFGLEGMSMMSKIGLFYRYKKTYGKNSKSRQRLSVDKIKHMMIDHHFDIEEARLIGENMKASFIIARKK